jgi:4-methyl-5(b-hydroxyethyl)-thiazole monophosphate biosynthesis
MPKKVIALLAEGFEEVEAVTPIDYLRRAGIEVTVAAVNKGPTVKGSHGIQVVTDASLDDLSGNGKLIPSSWDAVVVPGGLPGADNLAASKPVGDFLKGMAEAGKVVAAICASPARVLAPLGLFAGKEFTCYPGEEKNISASRLTEAEWKEDRVVIDGNLITSRGAGTAGEFAVAIIGKLINDEEAKKLAGKVLL